MVAAILTIRRIPGTGTACMAGFQLALVFRYFTFRGVSWPVSLLVAYAITTSLKRERGQKKNYYCRLVSKVRAYKAKTDVTIQLISATIIKTEPLLYP